jgi:hypothetical protein
LAKHKDRSPLGDWQVHLTANSITGGTVVVTVAQAWYERAKRAYVFHDEAGICGTFPIAAVRYITCAPKVIHALTGHRGGTDGSEIVRCACGARFAGTTRDRAEELIRGHVAHPDREPGWDYSEAAQ